MAQLIAIAIVLAAWQLPGTTETFPSSDELARQVRLALTEWSHADEGYTYIEERREVDISRLGKVTIGPLRTFEVYPSQGPGQTYKRLIAVDGRPLDADELARRDAEHARNLRQAAERAAREGPRQRAARLQQEEKKRRDLEAMFDDAVAVFAPVVVGRELIDEESVLVVDLHPRDRADVRTREGGWMQHFRGRIWVAESDYQVIRLDMRAFRDITVGWGVVGRVHEGSRIQYSMRRFDGVWLPAELSYEATGRTLLVRPFAIAATTTWSDYRRQDAAATPRPAGAVNRDGADGV